VQVGHDGEPQVRPQAVGLTRWLAARAGARIAGNAVVHDAVGRVSLIREGRASRGNPSIRGFTVGTFRGDAQMVARSHSFRRRPQSSKIDAK